MSGVVVLVCPQDGPLLGAEQDALDLIGDVYGQEVDLIAIPVGRMTPDFFRLRTGLLGAFVQKLLNYRYRIAFVGDLADQTARSPALRDFIYESNKGGQVLFVGSGEELAPRL